MHAWCYVSVRQNFLFMARPWMIWGVLSLYNHFVTCFCEVSLCSCESKKTIRLTDPIRSLPSPLLPFTCPFTARCCPLLPFSCPLLPFAALYLPYTTLYPSERAVGHSGYRLGYRLRHRLPSHISHGKLCLTCRGSTDMSQQMIFVDLIAFGGSYRFPRKLAKSGIPRSP